MFIWNDEMIWFMEDAAGYGDYHKRLAKMVHGYIPEAERICDAGCGLGFLSLELSQYYSDITAVDLSPKAISVLEKNIEERGIGNIRPFSGDIHQMIPQKPYDSMVFCFFGQLEEILKIARQQCKDSVITVSYTHLDVYKRQCQEIPCLRKTPVSHGRRELLNSKNCCGCALQK